MTPRIRWYGPFAQRTGYARAGHDYLLALKKAGCELDIHVIGNEADTANLDKSYEPLIADVNELLDDDEPRKQAAWPTHVIVHTIPRWAHEFVTTDLKPQPGVKRVCLTTWETSKLPREDAAKLNENFDLVCVPAEHTRDIFWASGVQRVKRVPHCFDLGFWVRDREPPEPSDSGPYVFYSILVWAERKNPIGLLKAYLTEFNKSDNVLLRILTPPKDSMEHDAVSLIRSLGLHDLPEVQFITERVTQDELWMLHAMSHCYVTLTRAEGWGLGAFEACLMGNHVIATDWSGHKEFLSHYGRTAFVPCQMTPAIAPEMVLQHPVKLGGLTITPVGRIAPPGIAGDQDWAEPDLCDAKRAMRYAYNHFSLGSERFTKRLAQKNVIEQYGFDRYSYESVGTLFRRILEET